MRLILIGSHQTNVFPCIFRLNSPEECESKYQLVVKCCLQTLAKYMDNNDTDHPSVLTDSPKFWSFYKHKSVIIRAAWYEATAAILQHAPVLLVNHEQQLAKSILHNLDDNNPIVIPHLWASLLLFTHKIDNW